MRSVRRPVGLALLAFLTCTEGRALAQPAPVTPSTRGEAALPVLTLGALLPLSGPGAWFGTEIRRGLELALAEAGPPPRRFAAPAGGAAPSAGDRGSQGDGSRDPGVAGGRGGNPAPPAGSAAGAPSRAATPSREGKLGPEAPRAEPAKPLPAASEPIEPPDRRRAVQLVVKVQDVQPLDVAAAAEAFKRLLTAGAVAVFTASPTPTLTVYPQAASRDVLVLHCGLPTDSLPSTSRTLLQLRPSVAARGERLAAYAWAEGVRRLGVLADGDDFGRALRGTVGRQWQRHGGVPVHDESLSPDASDLRGRLRALVRAGPEAVVLGYRGPALGTMARAAREAGYRGVVLAADDDRAALLAGGPALEDARLLGDAFVAVPGTRGERFARAYAAKHGSPPSRFAAAAYEAALILVDAATWAVDQGRDLTGSRLREGLVTLRRFPSLYAGEVVVADDGTLVRPLALVRVEQGQVSFQGYVDPEGRLLGPRPALEPTGSAPVAR
jgi:ABC-type branched-subunit amino acid transport system substrate-binding protein